MAGLSLTKELEIGKVGKRGNPDWWELLFFCLPSVQDSTANLLYQKLLR